MCKIYVGPNELATEARGGHHTLTFSLVKQTEKLELAIIKVTVITG